MFGSKGASNCRRDEFRESNMSTPLHQPNYSDKALHKESLRMSNNFSSSKRPRIDQPDSYVWNAEADEDKNIFQKDGFDLIQPSASLDKTRVARQKRCLDGKKTDRKSFKFGFKSRCDPFTPKGGSTLGDSHSGGNNIGICSIKSDRCDITKLIGKMDLHDLLDGSYKYSNVNPGKGRRHTNNSENILLSVRKALSILPQCSTDSGEPARLLHPKPCSLSTNTLVHDKQTESIELEMTSKATVNNSELLEAKDIFGRLSLPPLPDLDSLLLGVTAPSQSGSLVKSFHSALLPQFPWTNSHASSYRPNADSGKQILNRNSGQCRWFRIESNSSSKSEETQLLADLDLALFSANRHSLGEQKSDNHLVTPVDVNIATIHSKEGVPFSGSSVSKFQNKAESGKFSCCGAEARLEICRCDSHLVDSQHQFTENGVSQQNHHTSYIGYNSHCKDAVGDHKQSSCNQFTQELYKPGYCPQVHVAAEILLEMASCCNTVRTQNENCRKTKGWKAHSYKTVQATFKEVSENGSPISRHCDPAIIIDLPTSRQQHLEKKHDLNYMDSRSRGHPRCSVPIECGASTIKRERDLQFSPSRLNNATARPRKLIKSLSRVENGYNSQQYMRKMRLSESAVGGLFIKDWNSGRRKKE